MSLSCDTSDVVANVHKCTSGGSFFPRPPVNGAEIRQSGANQRGKHRRFSSLD